MDHILKRVVIEPQIPTPFSLPPLTWSVLISVSTVMVYFLSGRSGQVDSRPDRNSLNILDMLMEVLSFSLVVLRVFNLCDNFQ